MDITSHQHLKYFTTKLRNNINLFNLINILGSKVFLNLMYPNHVLRAKTLTREREVEQHKRYSTNKRTKKIK